MSMSIYKADNGNFVEWLSRGLRPRSLYASIAIAKAIADSLIIPSSEMGDVDIAYNSLCSIDAKSKLSPINEAVVLEVDVILEYIKRFWKVRYYTMFPKFPINGFNKETGLLSLFGLDYAIDIESVKAITDNFIEVAKIYNTIHLVVDSKSE